MVAVSTANGITAPLPSTEIARESPAANSRVTESESICATSGSFATTLVDVTVDPDAARDAENPTPGVLASSVKVRVEGSREEETVPSPSIAVLRSESVVSESVTKDWETDPDPTVTVNVSPDAGANGTVITSFCATARTLAVTETGAVVQTTSTPPTVNAVPAVAATSSTVVVQVRDAVTAPPEVMAEARFCKVVVPSVEKA